jgi:parallel beta-helix repeat protein
MIMRNIIRLLPTLLLLTACGTVRDTTSPSSVDHPPSVSGTVAVTSASCGDVIDSDLRLENDLTCIGDALTVAGSDIKINLNGHSITGNGTGVGIRVTSSQGVSIHGGIIRGFLQGMFIAASTGIVIKDNEFLQNATAVLLQASSGNTIKGNVARQNSVRAFMLRANLAGVVSTANDIKDNVLVDNPTGIFVISVPGNTIKANTITGSTVAAIDMTVAPGASGNVIKENLLISSLAGIKLGSGWTGNEFLGNTLQGNACGVQGPTASNTFKDNLFTGNGTNICP